MAITKRKKILCIDDDRTSLMIIKRTLVRAFSTESLDFYESISSEDGLKKITTIKPDVVLSDIQIPETNGFQICHEIRVRSPKTAVILISAYNSDEDNALRAKEVGADAYLSKPLKKGEVLFVIESIFREKQLLETVCDKNNQLEESLERIKTFHKKLVALNEELGSDKKRQNIILDEMIELNKQLGSKNNEISSLMREIKERFDNTVFLLTNIIEMNRPYRGHSERVADSSVYISKKLGLNNYQVENIRVAALIHELGIVGTPSYQKNGMNVRLKQTGFQNSHPLVGEMLLKSYPGFELIAEIIRHLYENFDGSGGPNGLHGDAIPIGSRIISAVSFYDHSFIKSIQEGREAALVKMNKHINVIFDGRIFEYLKEFVFELEDSQKERILECIVFNLSEGMELASDIFSESGINLLQKDTVLNKETILKILKFNNFDPIVGPIKIKQP